MTDGTTTATGTGEEPRIVAFVVVPGEPQSVLRTDAEALADEDLNQEPEAW